MTKRRRFGFASFLFVIALLLSLTLTVVGWMHYRSAGDLSAALLGILSVIVTLVIFAVSCQIAGAVREGSRNWQQFTNMVTERLEQFSVMLNLISEQQLISERAKSIAFRDKDHDTLQRAIREEMARGEFDAALLLVNEMASAFGYKTESAQLREEIATLNDAAVRRNITDATAQIDRDCSAEKWDEAARLAQQLASQYPNHELTMNLPQQVQQRKDAIKQQLLERWRDAVGRKDIDGSIDVLRALDIYVSPEEVAQLKDGALEIFKARIERLRERFKTCVHERHWHEALHVGEDIVQDFPTSKLAQEVRDMMDDLRARAAEEPVPSST